MSGAAERIFVGWDRLPIAAIEEGLADRIGAMSGGDALIALPGSRSGRVLGLRLARRFGPEFVPPRIVTLGVLVDELVTLPGPVAPRLVRTLAWQRALRELGPDLRAIAAHVPEEDDLRAWAGLAATVRGLHGELGAECADFATVARDPEVAQRPSEQARWRTLERAHTRFRALLAREGLLDPHDARREALAEGHVDRSRAVVLAGCVELSGLQRALLEPLGDRVTALVPAPAAEAAAFGPLGELDEDHWAARPLPIDLDRWRVVGEPADQARAVTAWLAELGGSRAPTEITVGVLDDEVRPALERRLAHYGLRARSAEGSPVAKSAPARTIAAAGAYLGRRSFVELADLVRLPEIEALLARACGLAGHSPAALLDRYYEEHLPDRVGRHWPTSDPSRREERHGPPRDAGAQVRRIHRAVEELLADLGAARARPLHAWAAPVRTLLEQVYGHSDLEATGRSGRPLREELAAIGARLADLETVPEGLSPEIRVRDALALLCEELAGVSLPPEAGDAQTIEVLGWLELPLDDAPALAVTGLAEGRVPASPERDAFLPDRLRSRLGLVDDQRRLARDACLLNLLLRSRPDALLVSARRDAARNPLAPSRLLLRGETDEVASRVQHAFQKLPRPTAPAGPGGRVHALPRVATDAPESIPVTAFKTYLESPYRYYIDRLLRLDATGDEAQEMDPAAFGTLLHEVLAKLGRSELVASTDAGAIERFLCEALDAIASERFGPDVLPAVTLQLLQARKRLSLFAPVQARRAAAGWQIALTEWAPDEPAWLDVDGAPIRLSGRIDRIDRHTDGRFAILDYKTGNSLPRFGAAYDAKGGVWRDPQLPLYRLLAAELAPGIAHGENVDFGWFCLGKDAANTAVVDHEGSRRWSPADLLRADAQAREIVRAIRAQAFDEVGSFDPQDPVGAALVGRGLVGMEEDPDPLAAALGDAVPPEVVGAPTDPAGAAVDA